MIRRSRRPDADAEAGVAFDLSMTHVPGEWVEAQASSPLAPGDPSPLRRPARFALLPQDHGSPFITNVVAAGAAFAVVAMWYFVETLGISRSAWIPTLAGVAVGLSIRRGGLNDPNYRLIASLGTYVLTVLVSLLVITHHDLRAIYGSYGLEEFEGSLIATRFAHVGRALALIAGAVLAPTLAVVGHIRR